METALPGLMVGIGWAEYGAGIIALLLCILAVRHRCQRRDQLLRAIIESFEKPLLFYNEYGRLVFFSSGLLLFDKKTGLKELQKLSAQPTRNQPETGEMVIDYNRYRYVSRRLEYSPGKLGTLVQLQYLGKVDGSH